MLLTGVTQIGGIVYVLSMVITKRSPWNSKYKTWVIFIGVYVIATFLITPWLAPFFGRECVKHTAGIAPTNYMTVVFNRNYVQPKLNAVLAQAEEELRGTGIKICYLDANFPFINTFPLLPHLSHNDGKKIDLSMIYETKDGELTNTQKSRSGYGVFEDPKSNEYNQIEKCLNGGYIQYDYPKYITFGRIHEHLVFSEQGTRILIKSILKTKYLGKLFIEPHLKKRMSLVDPKIRYHGCKAVRHDDHIHIQLK